MKRPMAEIFRTHRFHAVIHLGRVPVTATTRKSVRYNINVLGTRNLLDLSIRHGVKNVIVVSTFHVYGAHQHNHLQITEEDPLRASQIFAELSDAVELDNASTMFLLKYRDKTRTIILRPVNIVGPDPRPQRVVARALGQALGRPAVLPAPALALRVALGEFADDILTSQRVMPFALTGSGFDFEHPTLGQAAAYLTR